MHSVTLYRKSLITYSNEPAQHGQQRDVIDTCHIRSSLISATDDQLLPSRPDSGGIPSVLTERVCKLPIAEIRFVSARNWANIPRKWSPFPSHRIYWAMWLQNRYKNSVTHVGHHISAFSCPHSQLQFTHLSLTMLSMTLPLLHRLQICVCSSGVRFYASTPPPPLQPACPSCSPLLSIIAALTVRHWCTLFLIPARQQPHMLRHWCYTTRCC